METIVNVGIVLKNYTYNHLVFSVEDSEMKLWKTFLRTNWEIRYQVKMHRNLKER